MSDHTKLEIAEGSVSEMNFSEMASRNFWTKFISKHVWIILSGIIFVLLIIIVIQFCSSGSVKVEVSGSQIQSATKYNSSQLYLFGGIVASTTLSTASHYNSSSHEWRPTTDMIVPRGHSCGVVIGTKIYQFGGVYGVRLRTAEVYDSETGTYSRFRSMLIPRSSCGAAVLGDYIYVAGGYDGTNAMSSVIRYNVQTSRLETVTSMRFARNSLQMVEVGGHLYAIGGHGLKTVERYNATDGKWSVVASTHEKHFDFGAAVHDGKIYVCSHLGFEAYSPETDHWEVLKPLDAKTGRALVSMDSKLWALGGGASKLVHTYDPATNIWSEQPDMDVSREYHTAFVVNH